MSAPIERDLASDRKHDRKRAGAAEATTVPRDDPDAGGVETATVRPQVYYPGDLAADRNRAKAVFMRAMLGKDGP